MQKNANEMSVWYEGAKAYREGVPYEDCPYFSVLVSEWQDGWNAAADVDKE